MLGGNKILRVINFMITKKSRILYIVPLPPPVHGSAMVCQYIKDSNHIKGKFDGDFVNISTSRSLEEIGKRNFTKIFRFLGAYFIVFIKLLLKKYDLCYLAITCHGIGFLKDAPFVLLCKLFGRKVVIHQHNKGMSLFVNRPLYKWLFQLVYKNTKVILLSWNLYQDIEKIVKQKQVYICPNGIPEILGKTNITEQRSSIPRLLFLSNLIESKGVYVLLDACKILKEKGLDFTCNFVGRETKEIDRLNFNSELEKRGISKLVTYQGAQYGIEKVKTFQNSSIFVFPSYYHNECLPLVLMEAMQYKLPIITTNEGGIPDIVNDGENGFIVQTKDPISLASALEKLITNPKLCVEMGNNGYKKFKEQYTLTAFEHCFIKTIN
jgi:glycosyltransferase involved in cell wall biosynthesis